MVYYRLVTWDFISSGIFNSVICRSGEGKSVPFALYMPKGSTSSRKRIYFYCPIILLNSSSLLMNLGVNLTTLIYLLYSFFIYTSIISLTLIVSFHSANLIWASAAFSSSVFIYKPITLLMFDFQWMCFALIKFYGGDLLLDFREIALPKDSNTHLKRELLVWVKGPIERLCVR